MSLHRSVCSCFPFVASTVLATVLLAGCDSPPPPPPAAPPASRPTRIDRVVIISADGMRPDLLLRGEAPTIRWLMKNGAFTMWALTIDMPWTIPSHASMLTGVGVDDHGMWENWDYGPGEIPYPKVPTVFDVARAQGKTTAMAVGKSKMKVVARPESLNWSFIAPEYLTSTDVAPQAARIIRDHKPDLLFVHFPDADGVGHSRSWGSNEQVACVRDVDRGVATVLAALREAGLMDTTAIIFTADHGGAGLSHYRGDIRSHTIPWIVMGPGIKRDYDLSQQYYLKISTVDTFTTALNLLGTPPPHPVSGKFVMAIFENQPNREMMFDTPPGESDEATKRRSDEGEK